MSELLTEADLAFMRATQADARPTPAELRRRTQAPTASGGRGDTMSDPEPINIRLDGRESMVPPQVLAAVGSAKPVKITLDLVEVRSGDTITVSPTEVYQVVTDGDPDRWATAQVVWAKRTTWAKRT